MKFNQILEHGIPCFQRFTSIQQQTRQQPTVQNIRASMAAQQQASAANRRLAQQLANRPGIGMMNMAQQQPINMSPRYPSQPPQVGCDFIFFKPAKAYMFMHLWVC